MKTLYRTLLAVGLALPASFTFNAAHATTWDAAADFPDVTHANPNGVWSYGYDASSVDGYQLKLFDTYTSNGGIPFFNDASYNSFTTPNFKKNENSTVAHAVPFGMVSLHPGQTPFGDEAILRFTAPATDVYDVTAKFLVGDTGETQAWVVLNGNRTSPLASLGITSLNPSFALTAYRLQAGDTLDFVVGNNGSYFSDDTPLSVIITTTVPEPGSAALLLAGMGVIGRLARRRPLTRSV